MFRQLQIKSKYVSTADNLAEEFYNPILKVATKYDRISGYFSAKALALYSNGLEYFVRKGNKYRLIISKDISEEDYNLIKKGYKLKNEIIEELAISLEQDLTILQEKNISNLAYLIAIGCVEIKFAFKTEGLFHDKTGLFYDSNGDIICFNGSENETKSGLTVNYESIQVVCSWIDSNGFYGNSINTSEQEFENLWNNKHKDIIVIDAEKTIINKILKFNKGKIIMEEVLLEKNSVVLDYDDQLLLRMNLDDTNPILHSSLYKFFISPYSESVKNDIVFFRPEIPYMDFMKIGDNIKIRVEKLGVNFFVTNRLKNFIDAKNIHIENRSRLGISIRHKDYGIQEQFKKYSEIVNCMMTRKLRDIQMWDSFFMYAMEKSCNFSVPGSGKTSAALGVFAFLLYNDIVDKIVVIGPKNSFGSWIDEFNACFSGKLPLKLFNCQNEKLSTKQKQTELKYDYKTKNLFLFNYESLSNYENILSGIVSEKTLLVFDEVHKVKAINGEYASHALKVAKSSGYTIVMTGTPIPNSYCDIYNLLHILFNSEYNNFFGFDTRMLSDPSEIEKNEINKKLQPFFCRTTKKQLSVPEPNKDIDITCNATEPEQKIFEILSSKYIKNKLALFIRILQAESNPKLLYNALDEGLFSSMFDDFGNIDDIEELDYTDELKELINKVEITTKKRKCIDLIKELVKKGKTVILWCIFTDSIHSFEKLLTKEGIKVKVINGEIPLDERFNIINEFKSGVFSVLITNPHTLAESVSLHTVCHDAVYFEYSYNLVHLLQSKDRIHRLGLAENQYTQWYFMKQYYQNADAIFSLDEGVYKRLCEKEQIMLDAIENYKLEDVTTTQEDLDIIFKGLL